MSRLTVLKTSLASRSGHASCPSVRLTRVPYLTASSANWTACCDVTVPSRGDRLSGCLRSQTCLLSSGNSYYTAVYIADLRQRSPTSGRLQDITDANGDALPAPPNGRKGTYRRTMSAEYSIKVLCRATRPFLTLGVPARSVLGGWSSFNSMKQQIDIRFVICYCASMLMSLLLLWQLFYGVPHANMAAIALNVI